MRLSITARRIENKRDFMRNPVDHRRTVDRPGVAFRWIGLHTTVDSSQGHRAGALQLAAGRPSHSLGVEAHQGVVCYVSQPKALRFSVFGDRRQHRSRRVKAQIEAGFRWIFVVEDYRAIYSAEAERDIHFRLSI